MDAPKDLGRAYQNFFKNIAAGQYLLHQVGEIIVTNHEKAEREPSLARDYVQRAKGAREVLDHINSALAMGVEEA